MRINTLFRALWLTVWAMSIWTASVPLAGEGEPSVLEGVPCSGKTIETRAITVRFKSLSEAALLVDQLVSPCGGYRVIKSVRVITVDDEARNLERVAQAVASWDLPPRSVEVTISMIEGTREARPSGGLADEIRGVSRELAELTSFTSFKTLGTGTLRTAEGSEASLDITEDYRVILKVRTVDPDLGVIAIDPFLLLALPHEAETAASTTEPRTILSLAVNPREGRLEVIGAPSRVRDRALFLTLEAWSFDPEQGNSR